MLKIVTITILFCSATVHALERNYAGVDLSYWWLSGRDANNYAMRQVLGTHYNTFEVYAAHRFANDVGLSIGWQNTNTVEVRHAFGNNETFVGPPQNIGDYSYTQTQIRAVNVDVNGYANITENWEAIGMLGLSFMSTDMEGTLYDNGVANNLAPSHNFRPVPRIGLAVQYFFSKILGVRVIGRWVGTNMFHLKLTDEDGIRRNIKPFKQSWQLGVGIVGRLG